MGGASQNQVPGMGPAAIVDKNPVDVSYTAFLPQLESSEIRGHIAGRSNANGTGVIFNISLSGFPGASLGPFCKSDPYSSNSNSRITAILSY